MQGKTVTVAPPIAELIKHILKIASDPNGPPKPLGQETVARVRLKVPIANQSTLALSIRRVS